MLRKPCAPCAAFRRCEISGWSPTSSKPPRSGANCRGVPASHILAEPVGRNTAAAIGLAAIHLAHEHGDALMAVLPSDSYVADAARYRRSCAPRSIWRARPAIWWCSAFRPRGPKPATATSKRGEAVGAHRAASAPSPCAASRKSRRCRSRANMSLPEDISGMRECFSGASPRSSKVCSSFFRNSRGAAANLARNHRHAALRRRAAAHLSAPRKYLRGLRHHGTGHARSRRRPPRVSVIPAKVGWSDIGSWAAVYELLARKPGANVSAGPSFTLDAAGKLLLEPEEIRRRDRRSAISSSSKPTTPSCSARATAPRTSAKS